MPGLGAAPRARWTSRSMASWSRSISSSCSVASGSSAAIRAGRSPGSSRPPRRSPSSNADRLEPRQVRRPASLRHARAGSRRRGDDQAGHPAQRGGPGPQGHPRGRGGDRPARRRRDPPGPLAGAARGRARGPSAAPAPPARCPVCDTPTVKPEDSVFTRCPNRDCAGRRWQLLTSFTGAMDIDGLGEKQVSLFMDLGWVHDRGRSLPPPGRADRRAAGFRARSRRGKLVAAIEASKAQPFGRVLFALGIEEVGAVTGRNLAQQFRISRRPARRRPGGHRGHPGGGAEDGPRRSTSSFTSRPWRR